ncbi:unnamed protein product [Closterium sp. Naga37s-1]|nr:unnamed protein product [Closterium sp. Naga37s-1]
MGELHVVVSPPHCHTSIGLLLRVPPRPHLLLCLFHGNGSPSSDDLLQLVEVMALLQRSVSSCTVERRERHKGLLPPPPSPSHSPFAPSLCLSICSSGSGCVCGGREGAMGASSAAQFWTPGRAAVASGPLPSPSTAGLWAIMLDRVVYCMLCLLCSACYALPAMLCLLCSACYALPAMLCLLCSACYALPAMLCLLCSSCYALPSYALSAGGGRRWSAGLQAAAVLAGGGSKQANDDEKGNAMEGDGDGWLQCKWSVIGSASGRWGELTSAVAALATRSLWR